MEPGESNGDSGGGGGSRIDKESDEHGNYWVEALVIVKFDEKHGQQIQSCYPRNRLSDRFLNQLKMISMPDCLEAGHKNHEFIFLIKTSDDNHDDINDNSKNNSHNKPPEQNMYVGKSTDLYSLSPPLGPLHCYVSFRQCQDQSTSRGYFQQSLVLISRLPLHSLHFNILSRLSSVLADIPGFEMYTASNPIVDDAEVSGDLKINVGASNNPNNSGHDYSNSNSNSSSNSSSNINSNSSSNSVSQLPVVNKSIHLPFDLAILDSTLEVAFQHFVQWPPLRSGVSYNLPFYGSIVPFIAPTLPLYTLHPSLGLSIQDSFVDVLKRGNQGVEKDSGLFSSVNAYSIFGRLGLLPHLWTLWELVITGKDIVVWSQNAAISSAVVLALVSMVTPFGYCGDYRPYINSYDPDISRIADAIASRSSSPGSSSATSAPSSSSALGRRQSGLSSSPSSSPPSSLSTTTINHNDAINIYTSSSSTSTTNATAGTGTSTKPPGSVIVGITNPFLLRSFGSSYACLLLPNPESKKPKGGGNTAPQTAFNQLCEFASTGTIDSPPTSPTASRKTASSSSSSGFFSMSNVSSFISSTLGFGSYETGNASPTSESKAKNSGNDRNTSLELLQGTTFRFSPLGLAAVQDPNSSPSSGNSATRTDFSKPAYECSLKLIGPYSSRDDSLENIYDAWTTSGGGKPGSSRRHALLALRGKPTVSPDYEVQSNLLSIQKNQLDVNSSMYSLPFSQSNSVNISNKVSVRQDERCWADEDDKSVIGNMMIRGHFQSLNLELARVFEPIFGLNEARRSRPTLLHSSHESAVRADLAGQAVASTNNVTSTLLSKCLVQSGTSWRDLAIKFSQSDHFLSWYTWRMELLGNMSFISPNDDRSPFKIEVNTNGSSIERHQYLPGDWEKLSFDQCSELIEKLEQTAASLRSIGAKIALINSQSSHQKRKAKGASKASAALSSQPGSNALLPATPTTSGSSSSILSFINSTNDADISSRIEVSLSSIEAEIKLVGAKLSHRT